MRKFFFHQHRSHFILFQVNKHIAESIVTMHYTKFIVNVIELTFNLFFSVKKIARNENLVFGMRERECVCVSCVGISIFFLLFSTPVSLFHIAHNTDRFFFFETLYAVLPIPPISKIGLSIIIYTNNPYNKREKKNLVCKWNAWQAFTNILRVLPNTHKNIPMQPALSFQVYQVDLLKGFPGIQVNRHTIFILAPIAKKKKKKQKQKFFNCLLSAPTLKKTQTCRHHVRNCLRQ